MMGQNVRLLRAMPSYCYRLSRLGTVLRDHWRAEFGLELVGGFLAVGQQRDLSM
jgi:hypothetical protein